MVRFVNGLWIALLAAIAAALMACGSVPSPDASRPDANSTDAAVTDRPAPPPDVTSTPDTPLPPPPDAMQIAPDLPPPPPDAPAPEDASIPPMDAPPPPPDVAMTSFSPGVCSELPLHRWRIRGTESEGDTIGCRMQSNGNAALELPDNIAGRLGEISAVCNMDQTCHVPDNMTPSHWACNGWSIPMTEFSCSRGSERVVIERVR